MASDFLTRIVSNKLKEIDVARKAISEADLRKKAENRDTIRPFFTALERMKGDEVSIIAEIKRASPSKGDIRIDLDPAVLAADYEKGGAACLSVLTDSVFFKGGFDDFRNARSASSIPMLRKDFLVSEYQIFESAVLGADAVLLIARILTKEKMKQLFDLATGLGMDSLVEIHTDEDLDSALSVGAKLIGINNRNLSSFDTDISRAVRLSQSLDPGQIPVAASGISTRDDIENNLSAGINHFLIGESLVRAENTVAFMDRLIHGEKRS
jgi:indole-3-glycerol phosphate synthase